MLSDVLVACHNRGEPCGEQKLVRRNWVGSPSTALCARGLWLAFMVQKRKPYMQVEMFVEMFEMEIVQQMGMSGTRLIFMRFLPEA